jgi:hypothetical protein
MPINPMKPPFAAVAAFRSGLEMLADADARFSSLQEKDSLLPPAHPVVVYGLDTLIAERLSRNLVWRYSWAEWSANRIWRFFVSSEVIPVGVVEVIPRAGGDGKFEFLAFREGKPVELAAETFHKAISENAVAEGDGFHFHLLKVPGLCADFYLFRKSEPPRDEELLAKSWIVSIFQAPVGFVAGQAYHPNDVFEILRKESARVLNMPFVQELATGFDSEPGQDPFMM